VNLNLLASVLLLSAVGLSPQAYAAIAGEENCRVVIPDMDEREKVKWTGSCADGYADGNGVLLRYLKKVQIGSFEGRMARGVPVEGYEKLPGGAQYEGRYEGGLRDGAGTFASSYGDIYTGTWKAGARQGKGTITFAMGGEYTGEWAANAPVGTGTIKYAGGQRVEEHAPFPARPVAQQAEERFQLKAAGTRALNDFESTKYAPSATLPFDKSYAELTPAQKAIVRRSYALLHPDDEPPYPEHGAKQISEVMHQWQALALVDGSLIFRVLVDSSGHAKSVTFLSSPYPKLNDLIVLLMGRITFKPALCGGVPCEMNYPFCFSFVTEL